MNHSKDGVEVPTKQRTEARRLFRKNSHLQGMSASGAGQHIHGRSTKGGMSPSGGIGFKGMSMVSRSR